MTITHHISRMKDDDTITLDGKTYSGADLRSILADRERQQPPLNFTIEQRGEFRILQEIPGPGCRPATDHECALWDALHAGRGEPVARVGVGPFSGKASPWFEMIEGKTLPDGVHDLYAVRAAMGGDAE